MIRLVLALILMTGMAQAQDRYAVTGVASNDVLNIRMGPNVTDPKIGEYLPEATGIEVIRTTPDGGWAMVGLGERNGWVAARFLVAEPAEEGVLPTPMSCFGTEPFWSLRTDAQSAAYNDPEAGRIDTALTTHATGTNGYLARFDSVETAQHLIITQGYCSDGMSDREFAYSAALFFQSAGGSRSLTGCCTFDAH